MWQDIQGLVNQHPGIRAAAIMLASVLAAFVVEAFIRVTALVLVRKTKTELDDTIVHALQRPIFVTVIVIGGYFFALPEFEPSPQVQALTSAALKTVAIVLWSGAAIAIGHALLHAMSRKGQSSRKHSVVQRSTLPLFDMALKLVVVGGAVYFGFLAWDVDVTAWLASAGIVGIAIGFAAKDTLANLFAGIFILADAPYKIGDFIVLEDGVRGQVSRIGIRSTRVQSRDRIEITIPNAVIGNSKIVNEAGGDVLEQRIRVKVEVAYGSDIDRAREVLLGCAEGVEHVLTHPPPEVRFRAFGGSGLEFELLVYLREHDRRGLVLDLLNCRVYKRLGEAGIEIPYSKHDVYIKELPKRAGALEPPA